MGQIKQIEDELPNVPLLQRNLENFKREVNIYSDVLKDLSSQELAFSMAEASEVSNVRIINTAEDADKSIASTFNVSTFNTFNNQRIRILINKTFYER